MEHDNATVMRMMIFYAIDALTHYIHFVVVSSEMNTLLPSQHTAAVLLHFWFGQKRDLNAMNKRPINQTNGEWAPRENKTE